MDEEHAEYNILLKTIISAFRLYSINYRGLLHIGLGIAKIFTSTVYLNFV